MVSLNMKLIIPIGRLAIDTFYVPSKTLEYIIGAQMRYASAKVIPLPHPDEALSTLSFQSSLLMISLISPWGRILTYARLTLQKHFYTIISSLCKHYLSANFPLSC